MGLDAVELLMAVEEEFGIDISDAEAECTRTVGELHALVVGKLSPTQPREGDIIFDRLKIVICQQLGVQEDRVTPDARFVGDLYLG